MDSEWILIDNGFMVDGPWGHGEWNGTPDVVHVLVLQAAGPFKPGADLCKNATSRVTSFGKGTTTYDVRPVC